MSSYGTTVIVGRPFDVTSAEVRAALADEGFGVLTEIDVRATMKAKLDVDVPSQVILGACNPALAHRALELEPSIGLLLPCNVVVREGQEGTIVEAIDPVVLVTATGNAALEAVASEVREKLAAVMRVLGEGR